MSSKARPTSAQSRTAWGDAGNARPDCKFDFGGQDGIRDDPDLNPTAMEDDSVYMSDDKNKNAVATTSKKQSKSCFAKIGGGIRSLWATRQTEDVKGDRELHVKTTLRELIIYVVFLVILCIVTFGMTQTTMFYYTKVMSDLFLDKTHSGGGSFRTITSVEDFWKFAKGPLINGLYWETWYNNETVPADQQGYIYYENKLLGVPRLRQLQVHSNSCIVHDDFKDVIRDCYESYAESLENKQAFGPGVNNEDNYTAWYFQSQDELDGSSHWGKIATYSGAGYIQDLTLNKSESAGMIDHLFDKRWIRRGTRVLFIDFTVYNANINLFCVIRLTVEFPPTGGAIPHATMRTVKLIRYVTVMDYFIMACEFILCLFIFYYMIEEAIEIKKHKFSYFKSVWNILDILVIVIALVCVAFNVYRTLEVDKKLQELLDKPDQYADFEFLSYGQTQFDNAIAIAVFLAWIKIFKYISFNKTMTQLSSTLGKCAKDLAGFAVMFFIIFLAFTQLGYLLFGTQVKDFSNFQNSFFTLFRIILGDFDFDQLEAANRVLGPIFFMLFVFFVFFVLINMFLAIINDTYSEVKGDMANQKNEFEMGDYFKRGYEKMLNKLNFKHDKIVDIQKALESADINNDKRVDFDEWRQDLKTRGYADGEIEALFAKYDIDGDRILDEAEQKKMVADLNDQKDALKKEYDELDKIDRPESARRSTSRVSFNDDSADDSDDEDSHTKSSRSGPSHSVSYEEFTVLSRRVDRMEHSIGSIVSKIDAVLVKLEAMEKAKLKRRETMGKILDSITESDGTSDEVKREQMERLVREELERWDSESSITPQHSGRGASPMSSGHGGARARSRPASGGNAPSQDKVISQEKQLEVTAEPQKPETPLIGEILESDNRLDQTEQQELTGSLCESAETHISDEHPSVSLSMSLSHSPETFNPSFQPDSVSSEPLTSSLQVLLSEEKSVQLNNEDCNIKSYTKLNDVRPVTPILPGIPTSTYSQTELNKGHELSLYNQRLSRHSLKRADRNNESDDRSSNTFSKSSDRINDSNAHVLRSSSEHSDKINESDEKSSGTIAKSSDRNDDSYATPSRPSSKSPDRNDDSNARPSKPTSKRSVRNDETNAMPSRPSSKSSDRNDDSNARSSRPSSKSSDRRDDSKSSDRIDDSNARPSRPSSKGSDRIDDSNAKPSRPSFISSDRNDDSNARSSRPSSKSSDRIADSNARPSRPSSKSSDRIDDSNARSSRPSSKSSDRIDDSNARPSRPSSKSSDRIDDSNARPSRPSSKSSDRIGPSRPSSKSSGRIDDSNARSSRPSSKSSDRIDDSNARPSRPSSKSSDRKFDSKVQFNKYISENLDLTDHIKSGFRGSSKGSSRDKSLDLNRQASQNLPLGYKTGACSLVSDNSNLSSHSSLAGTTLIVDSQASSNESLTNSVSSTLNTFYDDSPNQFKIRKPDSKSSAYVTLPLITDSHLSSLQHTSASAEEGIGFNSGKVDEICKLSEHEPKNSFSVLNEQKIESDKVSANPTDTGRTVKCPKPVVTAMGQKVSLGTLSKMASKGVGYMNNSTKNTQSIVKTQLRHQSSTLSANQSKTDSQPIGNSHNVKTQSVESSLKAENETASHSFDIPDKYSGQKKRRGTSTSPSSSRQALEVTADIANDPPEISRTKNTPRNVTVDRQKDSASINLPAISSRSSNRENKRHDKDIKHKVKRPAPPKLTHQSTITDTVEALDAGSHKAENKMHKESAIFV